MKEIQSTFDREEARASYRLRDTMVADREVAYRRRRAKRISRAEIEQAKRQYFANGGKITKIIVEDMPDLIA